MWLTPNQFVSLRASIAYGVSGTQTVGSTASTSDGQSHATLWTSFSPSSAVDLNPGKGYVSVAYGVSGNQQVGVVDGGVASLWTGSAASWVNLGSGQALGVWDGTQVGWAGPFHAALWQGTAASMVDLNPPGFMTSEATGISHGEIVGSASSMNFTHALLWTGSSASSAVDLNGVNLSSAALATNGVQQVGYVSNQVPPNGGHPMDQHAVVWTGTAASIQALPIPPRYRLPNLVATAIDSDGDIVGNEASVMWIPRRVPGDANFDGTVDFSDLLIVARNYGRSGDVGFVNGDFDMDGSVGFDDLIILARNYGGSAPTASQLAQFDPVFRADVEAAFADVPEPSLALWFAAAAGLLVRQHRCR